jgi:hypothetical protein
MQDTAVNFIKPVQIDQGIDGYADKQDQQHTVSQHELSGDFKTVKMGNDKSDQTIDDFQFSLFRFVAAGH